MNEETKDTIKGLVTLGAIAGSCVLMAYGSYKILALMTSKMVVKELLKNGVILVATV